MKPFRWFAAGALVLGLAGCESGEETLMPDVLGVQLDVALSDIERAGFTDDVEVLGGGIFGIVDKSNWTVCEQEPLGGQAVSSEPRLTVDRSCGSDDADSSASSEDSEEESTADPEPVESSAPEYVYQGMPYEIVTIDQDMGPARLDQYWVLASGLDVSTDAYRDQIRLIIADIAHAQGTAKLMVDVVTDPEIIAAESASTIAAFMNEHGEDYFRDVIAPKEATSWIASYSGGYDSDLGEPSDAPEAFEIIWWGYGDIELETWSPAAG